MAKVHAGRDRLALEIAGRSNIGPLRYARAMSPEVIAIATVGISLAGLILAGLGMLRAESRRAAGDRISAATERAAIRADLRRLEMDFGQRLARLEGAFACLRPAPPEPAPRSE